MVEPITTVTPWGFWVSNNDAYLAGVVRSSFAPHGAAFITPDSFGLQLAVMDRPKGHKVPSHHHLPVPRSLVGTQEVLLIRRGSLRADLFDDEANYLGSVELLEGDMIVLNSGGHGFEASEDCLFVEVKQGPFVEGHDKVIFSNSVGSSTPIRMLG